MPRNRRKPVGNKAKKEYLKRKRKQKREKTTISKLEPTISKTSTTSLSSSLLRSHYSLSDTNRRKRRAQEGLTSESSTLNHKSYPSFKFRIKSSASASLPFFSRPDSDTKSPKELDEIETRAFCEYLEKIKGEGFDSLLPFEKNLEVWRQLWRTFEQWSDLAVIVADVRCPLLYLPESFVRECASNSERGFVIVLSKCDLVPSECVSAWQQYLKHHYEDE